MADTAIKSPTNYADYSGILPSDFTGREWVFREVDAWLREPTASRYFLIIGEPGSGKSAIAARLAQFSAGEASPPSGCLQLAPGALHACHFCRASASDSIDPRSFAKSISLQLATIPEFALALKDVGDKEINIDVQMQVGVAEAGSSVKGFHIENLVIKGLNGQEAFNRTVLAPLLTIYSKGYNQPIVVLVDSLDEALASSTEVKIVNLLAGAHGLNEQVRFILTSRPEPRVENNFLVASGMSLSDRVHVKEINKDILDYVERRLQNDDKLKSQLATLDSAQVAALPDLITTKAEVNFQYVVFLLKACAEGHQSMDNLTGLPAGLDGLYYSSLDRVVKQGRKDWVTAYKPLLGVLSVAQEPLTLSQLQTFTGLPGDVWDVFLDLRQFIETALERAPSTDQEEPEDRYRLYHQSIVDFLRRRQLVVTINGQEKTRDNMYRVTPEDWHKRIADYYWQTFHHDWLHCDNYGLTNLALHLFEGKQFDRLAGLISREWMLARYQKENHTYAGFGGDVDLAWRAALSRDGDGEQAVAQSVWYALIRTSINSVSSNYVPALVARALEEGLWTSEQVVRLAHWEHPHARPPYYLWVAILRTKCLDKTERIEAQGHALQSALGTKDQRERAFAFSSLAPHLDGEAKRRALAEGLKTAQGIRALPERVDALIGLASQLDGTEKEVALEESLTAVQKVWDPWNRTGDSWRRAKSLCDLAPHVTQDQASRGLKIADSLERGSMRMKAQLALVSRLPEESQALTVHEALEAVERSLEVLRGEAQMDTRTRDEGTPVSSGVLTVRDCFQALSALIPCLSKEAGDRIIHAGLDALHKLDWRERYSAISEIAPALNRDLALAEWGTVSEGGGSWGDQGPALAALASRMEGEDRWRLFAETARMQSAAAVTDRIRTLAEWIPILEGDTRQDALRDILNDVEEIAPAGVTDVAAAIAGSALESALPYLTGDLVRRGLDAVLSPWCEPMRSHRLTLLAPNLTGELLVRSLDACTEINDEGPQIRVMAALLARLTCPAKDEAIRDTFGVARQIPHAYPRARAMAQLAPLLVGEDRNQALRDGLKAAKDSFPFAALAFKALAPHLSGELIEVGIATARECSMPHERAESLAIMASKLNGEAKHLLAQEALATLAFVSFPGWRTEIVTRLAPHLDRKWHKPLWDSVQELAPSPGRAEALAAIAQAMPEADKENALRASLEAASQIENPRGKVRALVSLVPALAGDLSREAIADCLRMAAKISEEERVEVLVSLSRRFSKKEIPGFVHEAVECLPRVEDRGQGRLVVALAPELTGDLLKRAAIIAEGIRDKEQRAEALSAVALQLIQESKQNNSRQAVLRRLGSWLFSIRECPRSVLLNFCTTCLLTEEFLSENTLAVIAQNIREVAREWHFYPSPREPV